MYNNSIKIVFKKHKRGGENMVVAISLGAVHTHTHTHTQVAG